MRIQDINTRMRTLKLNHDFCYNYIFAILNDISAIILVETLKRIIMNKMNIIKIQKINGQIQKEAKIW